MIEDCLCRYVRPFSVYIDDLNDEQSGLNDKDICVRNQSVFKLIIRFCACCVQHPTVGQVNIVRCLVLRPISDVIPNIKLNIVLKCMGHLTFVNRQKYTKFLLFRG